MLTSGIIIDQYDDPNAYVLRQYFHDASSMPDLLKSASVSPDPEQLPDEAFALIMVDGDHTFRKYAMCDPVTASRSAFYFLTCGGKLPLEAQKVAAVKLATALLEYDIQPPKAMLDLARLKAEEDEAEEEYEPDEDDEEEYDEAEEDEDEDEEDDTAEKESAGADKLFGTLRKTMPSQRFLKSSSIVDTTGLAAPERIVSSPRPTTSNMYALVKNGQARYPIDSLDRVYKAVDYFNRYEDNFDLADRRQYCTKVASRMDELGLEVPQRMRDYASRTPDKQTIALAIYKRAEAIPSSHSLQASLIGLSKEASAMSGELLVSVFEEFDRQADLIDHWDRAVPNPILSVYKEKTAEAAPNDLMWEDGADRMSYRDFTTFVMSTRGAKLLKDTFSSELADDLLDPKSGPSVFNSLPDPHKVMIARMATDNSDGNDRAHGF